MDPRRSKFIKITWQDGFPAKVGRNGADAEDTIEAVIDRITDLNKNLPCLENALAVQHLLAAKDQLLARTLRRQLQGVEGTDQPHVTEEAGQAAKAQGGKRA